jgi:hypothetical protein
MSPLMISMMPPPMMPPLVMSPLILGGAAVNRCDNCHV